MADFLNGSSTGAAIKRVFSGQSWMRCGLAWQRVPMYVQTRSRTAPTEDAWPYDKAGNHVS